jgi:ribosome-associated protein YbcJ (S4-like RNA binding protein)
MNRKSAKEKIQTIRGDMITLGQLIKLLNLVQSGAEVKEFLAEEHIEVNGEFENRRGRKLYSGDLIVFPSIPPIRLVSTL